MSAAVAPDGAWIHWRAHGPAEPDGEPVLLIMGLGGSGAMWWRLVPHLSARRTAIVFDHRGTGDSDPVRRPLAMADLVGDALAVLDDAGIERAHVVGVSLGGMVAQQLALAHRDRVGSLVLGCTSPGGRRGVPPWRLLASAAARPFLGPGGTFDLVAPDLYAARTRRERPERVREDYERRVREGTDPRTIWAQLAAAAGHDVRVRLSELAGIATLVLHGEEDRLVPPARARELAAAIPGARLVMVPDCGHLLGTDAEEATSAAILEHVADVERGAPAGRRRRAGRAA